MSEGKLKEVNFTPKTDIQDYLYSDPQSGLNNYLLQIVNREIFNSYSGKFSPGFFKAWKSPLDFFNQLHELFEIIKANKRQPAQIVSFINNLQLEKMKKADILFNLIALIEGQIIIHRLINKKLNGLTEADQLEVCLSFIRSTIQTTIDEASLNIENKKSELIERGLSLKESFIEKIKNDQKKIDGKQSKLNYLINTKAELEQIIIEINFQDNYLTNIVKWCELEIERLELELPVSQTGNEQTKEKEFPKQTKNERLTGELKKYGFFELELIKELPSKGKLLEILGDNKVPYKIAMLEFLGFINHLEDEYCNSKTDLWKLLSEIISIPERTAKGHVNALNDFSNEDKKKYTSHIHKENVKKDYQKLK